MKKLNNFKHLSWDSRFFEKKIGQIILSTEEEHASLSIVLSEAIEKEYELLYLVNFSSKAIESEILKKYSGEHVDTKVTFLKQLVQEEEFSSNLVKSCPKKFSSQELNELAIISGEYSRFNNSKYFSQKQFSAMYLEWLRKSISREIASEVFIYQEEEKILGFVTVNIEENRGRIGLIAVNKAQQKKGIGRQLIHAVSDYLLKQEIHELIVSTQKENIKAIQFYLGNRLNLESEIDVYHFHLMA